MKYKLKVREHKVLCEALRRFSRFGYKYNNKITQAWTGLGCATKYNPAVDAGLMVCATTLNPGYMTWWRLTRKGARIVRAWLNAYKDIERKHFPPHSET